jgi:hypothetical protein
MITLVLNRLNAAEAVYPAVGRNRILLPYKVFEDFAGAHASEPVQMFAP